MRESLTNDQIGQRLGITAEGAKYHVSEILSKLGVGSREEAARWQPRGRKDWRALTTPLLVWRRLGVGWFSLAIGGALVVAVAAGIALLVSALVATRSGSGGTAATGLALLRAHLPIAAGDGHTCILTRIGGVKCWGSNDYGQLGNRTRSSVSGPVDVTGLGRGAIEIVAGGSHTCALLEDGTAECWGANANGGVDGVPVAVSGLGGPVAAITAGANHNCALTPVGGVKCWGENSFGQLGDGTTAFNAVPVDVAGLQQGAIAISAGGDHTCALMGTATVKCWGRDSEGELGDSAPSLSTEQQRISRTPLDVRNEDGTLLAGVAAVSAGAEFGHTCALLLTGTAKCWGSNAWGELGDAVCGGCGPWARAVAVDVSGLTDVVALSAGGTSNQGGHTCAVTHGGRVYCWGRGYEGQIGDGVADYRSLGGSNIPVPVVGIRAGAIAVAAGARHTCAIMSAGDVKCWGWNGGGQLGSGTAEFSNRPVDVPNVLAAVP